MQKEQQHQVPKIQIFAHPGNRRNPVWLEHGKRVRADETASGVLPMHDSMDHSLKTHIFLKIVIVGQGEQSLKYNL